MGRKKQNLTQGNPFLTTDTPPAAAPTPEIRLVCETSLTALRQGDHTKALELISEALAKHDDSALVHRVHGMVHETLTSLTDDSVEKKRHVNAAIESAKKATELAPNWIDLAHFYASLLFDYNGEHELAVAECERALRVENPLDPAEESFHVGEETVTDVSTPETRVSKVREELRNLIQKGNLASITNWMKSLHEEKYSLIPVHGSFNEVKYGVPTGPDAALPQPADN